LYNISSPYIRATCPAHPNMAANAFIKCDCWKFIPIETNPRVSLQVSFLISNALSA
jgi:hypothetical protein